MEKVFYPVPLSLMNCIILGDRITPLQGRYYETIDRKVEGKYKVSCVFVLLA